MTQRHDIAGLVEEWRGEALLMSHRGLTESAALVASLANDLEETPPGLRVRLVEPARVGRPQRLLSRPPFSTRARWGDTQPGTTQSSAHQALRFAHEAWAFD